eukprot:9544474-Ditylum_brightwellii.AAC.2
MVDPNFITLQNSALKGRSLLVLLVMQNHATRLKKPVPKNPVAVQRHALVGQWDHQFCSKTASHSPRKNVPTIIGDNSCLRRFFSLKDIHQDLVKVTLWAWKPKVRDEYTAVTSVEEGPNVTQLGGWNI